MVVPAHPPAVGWWVSRIPVPTRWVSRIPLLSDSHSGFRVWWVSHIPPADSALSRIPGLVGVLYSARIPRTHVGVPYSRPVGVPYSRPVSRYPLAMGPVGVPYSRPVFTVGVPYSPRTWVSRIHVPRNEPSGCPVFTVFTPRNASLQYRIRQGGGLRSSSCHVPG